MGKFAKSMKRWSVKTGQTLEKVTTDSITELFRTITFWSPIGDPSLWMNSPPKNYQPGTFINSWNTSAGAASPVVRSPDTFAKATFSQINTVVPLGFGQVISFENPTPYAFPLEFGHSSQAPNGMVRRAVQTWPTIIRKQIQRNR